MSLQSVDNNVMQSEIIYKNNLSREKLINRYKSVRKFTEDLCENLVTEDYVVQSMPDASPTKWHLAHTTWFWEAFVLREVLKDYKSIKEEYNYLFNSYYIQIGERFFRPNRGLISRPSVKKVYEYREYVDKFMLKFLEEADEKEVSEIAVVVDVGLNHEQQHQELMLTDIKHVFSMNPLYPALFEKEIELKNDISPLTFTKFNEDVYEVGYKGNEFFYDNEQPIHKQYLQSFKLSNRLVTNKEFIDFINDGGYKTPTTWLSNGAATVDEEQWDSPLYWKKIDGEWWNFTLNGLRKINPAEPVTHISFYEAEAFAHWAGYRLPTEFEWEVASMNLEVQGNFVDNKNYHPVPSKENNNLTQMYGDVWEWTRSDYAPYPGYKVPPGAIGEYNGKFMSGQIVLRGGSCATSLNHIRNTYRNFFPHNARWQFSGIRLAKDV